MIRLRRAAERGHADLGWLNTYYTFSFADYYDPGHMGFRSLRVMNEDRVQPGQGFGMHGHRDMEIVTYVLEGSLQHKDSMGHGSVIQPGELQCMTAGTGVRHSEFNASANKLVHLYQIWLLPQRNGLTPAYEQRQFSEAEKQDVFRLVASPTGEAESLTIHQDARIYLAALGTGTTTAFALQPGRHAWVQVLFGEMSLNDHALSAGDGAAVSEETGLKFAALKPSEVMLFDLA